MVGTTRPSLREWFYGLYALSPGTGLSCPCRRRIIICRLSLSVGRPGPHDFAVRKLIGRLAQRLRPNLSRPSHPAPNVRDDREAPLISGAGWHMIWHGF